MLEGQPGGQTRLERCSETLAEGLPLAPGALQTAGESSEVSVRDHPVCVHLVQCLVNLPSTVGYQSVGAEAVLYMILDT